MTQYTLDDLIIAYRKVKSDLFYDSGNISLIQIALYEENLINNLSKLLVKLNDSNSNYFSSIDFIGNFKIILKNLEVKNENDDVYFSDEFDKLNKLKIEEIGYRYIGNHSVDFHIISSLWIDKIGIYLEESLSENSYGCRLNRDKDSNNFLSSRYKSSNIENNSFNGHFKPYFIDYKRWQDNSVKSIEDALKLQKKIVVVTTDFKGFYHSINPDFLIKNLKDFINDANEFKIEKHLNLHSLFTQSLIKWSEFCFPRLKELGLITDYKYAGIPIGMVASKVIANIYLKKFDKEIETNLNPLFYGRYVDDIIIVIDNKIGLKDSQGVWKYIKSNLKSFSISNNGETPKSIDKENNIKQQINFNQKKEKLFVLSDESGLSFIENIKESMKENSSEWRLLPDSEDDIENLNKDVTSSSKEETVNGLRKADGISIQRLNFVLRLRNFETLVKLTPNDVWSDGLNRFISICSNFVLTPSNFDTYFKYFPRIFGLTISAKRIDLTKKLLSSYHKSWDIIFVNFENQKSLFLLNEVKSYTDNKIYELIISNFDFSDKTLNDGNDEYNWILNYFGGNLITLKSNSLLLFHSDFHNIPFKNVFFDLKLLSNNHSDFLKIKSIDNSFLRYYYPRYEHFLKEIEKYDLLGGIPNALFFYTRTFSTLEITLLYSNWSHNRNNKEILNGFLELFSIPKFKVTINDDYTSKGNDDYHINFISFENKQEKKNPTVALTNFFTDEKSWTANVRNDHFEPDKTRYSRLFKLINNIINSKVKIDYIVLPELSIPRQLIVYLANQLKSKGISLIAGIEYEKQVSNLNDVNFNGTVSNQLLYILNISNDYYNEQVSIIQEKIIPAFHEETELFNVGGFVLKSASPIKYIFDHNDFFFSGLVCNELLNIDYRQPLRGLIDAIFVIEWNKDVDMYDHIISATSNDIHCNVIQVNNRKYGDTRLRAPFKEGYLRDQARIKGGELDYFVLATIKAEELREFQRFHRSPDKPFKPVPTGFKMSEERRKKDLK